MLWEEELLAGAEWILGLSEATEAGGVILGGVLRMEEGGGADALEGRVEEVERLLEECVPASGKTGSGRGRVQ